MTQECRRTDELLIYHTTHFTWSLGIFFVRSLLGRLVLGILRVRSLLGPRAEARSSCFLVSQPYDSSDPTTPIPFPPSSSYPSECPVMKKGGAHMQQKAINRDN